MNSRRILLSAGLSLFMIGAVFPLSLKEVPVVNALACPVSLTGGSAFVSNGDCVLKFTTVGTYSWTTPADVANIDVLVVAGGGGGGGDAAGGGGAGGYIYNQGVSVSGSYVVTVGGGGARGVGYGDYGTTGGDSVMGTRIAAGGGGGGTYNGNPGKSGGSSGGGAFPNANAGTPVAGQGNTGGVGGGGGSGPAAGGGGGAGGAGTSGNLFDGNGGPGIQNLITGTATWYAGGGGGGRWNVTTTLENGGSGIGGRGAGSCGANQAQAGVVNTGSGGGGAPAGCQQWGAAGSSGIVIIRYTPSSAPANSVLPVISGSTRSGQSLTATTGTWSGSPTPTFTYQWKSASTVGGTYTNISGATSSTFVLTANEINKFIKVQVTATNSAGDDSEISAATSLITGAPANTSAPVITGTVQTGQILTASNGSWSASPTPTYSYQWKSSSTVGGTYTDISGATSSTYAIISGDLNRFIKVEVTATNSEGNSAVSSLVTSAVGTAPVVEIVVNAPATTVATGQGSIATIAPSTVTIPAVSVTPTTLTTVASRAISNTTTTVAVPVTPPGPVVPPAPKIEAVAAGEVGVKVGNKTEKATVERVNNQYVVSVGALKATIAPMTSGSGVAALDNDGNLRLLGGSKIKITMNGFKPGSTIEAWLFSTPTMLGTAKVGTDGSVTGTFTIPDNADDGAHRIALVAQTKDGKPTTFTVGVMVGEWDGGPNVTLWLIVLPIVLAVGGALVIPATRRRRKIVS